MIASIRRIPSPHQMIWRLGLAFVLLAVGAAAGLAIRSAVATHGGTQTIHACISTYTGQPRIMMPGQAPNCNANELLVEWGSDTGGLAGGVDREQVIFSVPAGSIETQDVVCADPDDEVSGGGVSAFLVADVPLMDMRQSFPLTSSIWRVSIENMDLVNSHDAIAYALCVPTS